MSEAKKSFYQTPEGELFKKKLSVLTSKSHAKNKFENSKRSGWYLSKKSGAVFYGSSYELRLYWEFDNFDIYQEVEKFETQIDYIWEGRGHCLDCLVTYKNGKKLAIEVKPKSRLNEEKNKIQIEDSRQNALSQEWDFAVYTEDNFKMTEKEITHWADEFLTSLDGSFNWVEFRKEKNRERAKRHYQKRTSNDIVRVECTHCNTDHFPLRKTYEKNIKRNHGNYICESKGGYLSGKKPKKKKENPYESVGKKQCNKCNRILTLSSFSANKSTCKECRAVIYRNKYQQKKGNNE